MEIKAIDRYYPFYDAKSEQFATAIWKLYDRSSGNLGSHFGNLTTATRQTLAQQTYLSNPVVRYDQSVAIWNRFAMATRENDGKPCDLKKEKSTMSIKCVTRNS